MLTVLGRGMFTSFRPFEYAEVLLEVAKHNIKGKPFFPHYSYLEDPSVRVKSITSSSASGITSSIIHSYLYGPSVFVPLGYKATVEGPGYVHGLRGSFSINGTGEITKFSASVEDANQCPKGMDIVFIGEGEFEINATLGNVLFTPVDTSKVVRETQAVITDVATGGDVAIADKVVIGSENIAGFNAVFLNSATTPAKSKEEKTLEVVIEARKAGLAFGYMSCGNGYFSCRANLEIAGTISLNIFNQPSNLHLNIHANAPILIPLEPGKNTIITKLINESSYNLSYGGTLGMFIFNI